MPSILCTRNRLICPGWRGLSYQLASPASPLSTHFISICRFKCFLKVIFDSSANQIPLILRWLCLFQYSASIRRHLLWWAVLPPTFIAFGRAATMLGSSINGLLRHLLTVDADTLILLFFLSEKTDTSSFDFSSSSRIVCLMYCISLSNIFLLFWLDFV